MQSGQLITEEIQHTTPLIKQEFEINEANIGRPVYFDLQIFMQTIRMFLSSDEVETALYLLDNLPGWYRDNQPEAILELKNNIIKRICTIKDYVFFDRECFFEANEWECHYQNISSLGEMIDVPFTQPRAAIVKKIVLYLNKQQEFPHIVEMGPSSYWLPYGLLKYKLEFTYEPITIHRHALESHLAQLADVMVDKNNESLDIKRPKIFICFETLEHLWNPEDIYTNFVKSGYDYDVICLSTPKYTLFGGVDSTDKPIEHIRTWTPNEFKSLTNKWFGNKYNFEFFDSNMMVLVGYKKAIK